MASSNIISVRKALERHVASKRTAVISFDVFETLLFRRCHPSVVTRYVSRWLEMRLREEHLSPQGDIHRSRISSFNQMAAINCKSGYDYETPLADVVFIWLQQLCPSGPPEKLKKMADEVYEREIAAERMVCYANDEWPAFLRELSTRYKLIFMSDMYLKGSDIRQLLNKNGYRDLFGTGYVSGDHRLLKRTGNLYRHVLEQEGIEAGQLLHIGDNIISDYLKPASLSIEAILYQNHHQRALYEESITDAVLAERNGLWKGVAISGLSAKEYDEPFEQQLGRQYFGPIYCSFIHSVIDRCIEQGIQRIYFLSREGYLLQKLFSSMLELPDGPQAVNIETRYCCVSRLTTFLASISTYGPREVELALDNTVIPTLRNIFSPLALNADFLLAVAQRHGYSTLDEKHSKGFQETPRFKSLLNDPQLKSTISEKANAAKRDLHAYLESIGFFWPGRVAIVDVGWGGQIQYNIATSFKNERLPEMYGYYLATSSKARARSSTYNCMEGIFTDGTPMNYLGNALFEYVPCFEFIPRAPHGTVLGYGYAHDQIVPLFREAHEPSRYAEMKDDITLSLYQRGIMNYADAYVKGAVLFQASSCETLPYALQVADEFLRYPKKSVAQALLNFSNVSDLGLTTISDIGSARSWYSINPVKCYRDLQRSFWRPGSLAFGAGLLAQIAYTFLKYVISQASNPGVSARSRIPAQPVPTLKDISHRKIEEWDHGLLRKLDSISLNNYREARCRDNLYQRSLTMPGIKYSYTVMSYAAYLGIKSFLLVLGKKVSWKGIPFRAVLNRLLLQIPRIRLTLRIKRTAVRCILFARIISNNLRPSNGKTRI